MTTRFLLTLGLCLLVASTAVRAQEDPSTSPRPLSDALAREAAKVASSAMPTASQASSGSWMSRHPVGFGALAGAGVGLVSGLVAASGDCNPNVDTGCSTEGGAVIIQPLLGAGVGALVGLIVKLVR